MNQKLHGKNTITIKGPHLESSRSVGARFAWMLIRAVHSSISTSERFFYICDPNSSQLQPSIGRWVSLWSWPPYKDLIGPLVCQWSSQKRILAPLPTSNCNNYQQNAVLSDRDPGAFKSVRRLQDGDLFLPLLGGNVYLLWWSSIEHFFFHS